MTHTVLCLEALFILSSKGCFTVCRELPAHVSVSFHIPVVLSFTDQLKKHGPVPKGKAG